MTSPENSSDNPLPILMDYLRALASFLEMSVTIEKTSGKTIEEFGKEMASTEFLGRLQEKGGEKVFLVFTQILIGLSSLKPNPTTLNLEERGKQAEALRRVIKSIEELDSLMGSRKGK